MRAAKTAILVVIVLACLGLAPAPGSASGAGAPPLPGRPNVILIVVDDMGWTDLGSFGSAFYETPNIDRLAGEGMRFTAAYAACTVCSPSRASILTGQYPARLRLTDWIPGHVRPYARLRVPDWTMHLSPEVGNLAQRFKAAGYATISIGKWHLGGREYYPDRQGFDRNVGGYERGQPPRYFSPYNLPTLPEGPAGEFLTDREASEAVRFIEQNKDRPFFVYLPHYAVHQPIAGKPEVIEKYKRKADPSSPQHNATYAALVESVDASVGQILQKLDERKLAKNTVILFTSDNGGLLPVTANGPLRAGKGSAYEGGVRVPLIVRWPGVVPAGSVSDVPVIGADLYPTLLAVTGVQDAPGHIRDGESLAPLLRRSGTLKRDAVFWHYPHYHPGGATPYGAVRQGDFKLIEFFEDNHVELYHLQDDPGERSDLARQMPEKAEQLRGRLAAWRKEVGAQMPVPNPDYDPSKAAAGRVRGGGQRSR